MSQPQLTLQLPDDLYQRVRRAANGMKQPVEKALVRIVEAATPSMEKVPPAYRAELEALEDRSDDELWQIAEGGLPPAKERRLNELLRKNQRAELSDRERRALAELRTEADRVMLGRSYAYWLLKYRGHRVPNLGDVNR